MMSVAFKLACGIQEINGNHKNGAMRWEKTTPSPCLGVLHWAHPSLFKDIRMFWCFFFSWARGQGNRKNHTCASYLFPEALNIALWIPAWCHTISNSTNVFASGTWLASPSATSNKNKKKLQSSKVHTILLYILVMRFTSLPRISRISPNPFQSKSLFWHQAGIKLLRLWPPAITKGSRWNLPQLPSPTSHNHPTPVVEPSHRLHNAMKQLTP